MAEENIILKVNRKVWKPTTSTSSLVITLPQVDFLKEKDKVEIKVTSDRKITIEKVKK